MKYRAYLETSVNGSQVIVRVFPRSKKTSVFDSVGAAYSRLERAWGNGKTEARGIVKDGDDNLVGTIAL